MDDKFRVGNVKSIEITQDVIKEQMLMLSLQANGQYLEIRDSLIADWCRAMNVSKRVHLYFEMIILSMRKNKEASSSSKVVIQIEGNTKRYLKEKVNFTSNQELTNALRQLRDNDLIIRLEDGVGYYINPIYFFIGSKKERKEILEQLQKQLTNGGS